MLIKHDQIQSSICIIILRAVIYMITCFVYVRISQRIEFQLLVAGLVRVGFAAGAKGD